VFPPTFVELEAQIAEGYIKQNGAKVLQWKPYRNFGVSSRIERTEDGYVLITDNDFPVPLLVFAGMLFLAVVSSTVNAAATLLMIVVALVTYPAYRALQAIESQHAHQHILRNSRRE